MYRLLSQPANVGQSVCRWARIVGDFDELFGYSYLGDVFLRNPYSGQCAVLFTIGPELVPLGVNSIHDFIACFLAHPEAKRTVLQEQKVVQIEERLGALAEDEIFIPVPFPFLGGDSSVASYKKVDFYDYMELVGGLQDVEYAD